MIDFLLDVFVQHASDKAMIWRDQTYSYQWLIDRIHSYRDFFQKENIVPGHAVLLCGDASPDSIALLLALWDQCCIVVPKTSLADVDDELIQQIAGINIRLDVQDEGEIDVHRHNVDHAIPLYDQLRNQDHAGLVLFSSGSSGEPKGVVHDVTRLLSKFKKKKSPAVVALFMLMDHMGGIDSLLHILANGGCAVLIEDRSPDDVCACIEKHGVDVLPTTPTFLRLLMLSEAYQRYDLSSLKKITYGAESMAPSLLERVHALFPAVTLAQTYGLSELGALRTKSRSSDSLWMEVSGDDMQLRVVEGQLEIKTPMAMLGYLNAPSPFTTDGWFKTGDLVENEGKYWRILERASDIINVGGQKVYPVEIENVLLSIDNIKDASVYGEDHGMMGAIVCARVSLIDVEHQNDALVRIKQQCLDQLDDYKVPMKIMIEDGDLHQHRFKKKRLQEK